MYCGSCGTQITEQDEFCPSCGAPNKAYGRLAGGNTANELNNRPGDYQPACAWNNREDSMPVLSEGEQVVKSYHCAALVFPQCSGYLTVTNKRVIFHASTINTRINKEVQLDGITGFDYFEGRTISIQGLVLAAAVLFLSIIRAVTMYVGVALYLIFGCLIAAAIVLYSLKRSYCLKLFSARANQSPVSLSSGVRSMVGTQALSIRCRATEESGRMVRELGALIGDLQTMGDEAIEKWKK